MRTLCTAVLCLEWVVLALAVPVAINASSVPAERAWLVLGVATVVTVAAVAMMRAPIGVLLGWAVQGVAIASGLVVPILGVLGLLFAGLYFAAIRLGTKVDRIRAERDAQALAGTRQGG